jgi:sugar phosphate isomerase/epimerase
MNRQFSLAQLTVLNCAPPEMTYLAARAGYDFVSFRLIPLGTPGEHQNHPQDRAMLRQTKAALAETGLKMLDLELARIVAGLDPKSYLPAMEAAAELGARHVISSAWTTDRSDRNYLVDCFGQICDLAKPLGLTVELEFPSFSRLTNLQEAADVVRAADRENGGILIDTLYMHFSHVGLDELTALPRNWFHMAHLCDGPKEVPATREELIHVVRDARLYVGEGAIDVAAIVDRMPLIPYSIELPHGERVAAYGYEEHARRCLESARRYFDAHPTIHCEQSAEMVMV